MSQNNRELGTSGRNQYGITSEELRESKEQQEKRLHIDLRLGREEKYLAVVKNFPGLDAEMSEFELRRMASELVAAADKIKDKNSQ